MWFRVAVIECESVQATGGESELAVDIGHACLDDHA